MKDSESLMEIGIVRGTQWFILKIGQDCLFQKRKRRELWNNLAFKEAFSLPQGVVGFSE